MDGTRTACLLLHSYCNLFRLVNSFVRIVPDWTFLTPQLLSFLFSSVQKLLGYTLVDVINKNIVCIFLFVLFRG
jgi:hypothetical protein